MTAYKKILRRNFSRAARLYDKYCDIQNRVGSELLKDIPLNSVKSIFEIGCGTGNYTRLLRRRFKGSSIKAVDISRDMVAIAKRKINDGGVDFSICDAEIYKPKEKFDFVTSNATLHWFKDPASSIKKYKGLLGPGGIVSFSIFGPKTFFELNSSIKEALSKSATISAGNFLEEEKLKDILKRNFKTSSVRETIIKEEFDSLKQLLNKIKYTGPRGDGLNGQSFFLSRTLIKKIEGAYKNKFGKIQVTYQVFICMAVK